MELNPERALDLIKAWPDHSEAADDLLETVVEQADPAGLEPTLRALYSY